MSASTGDDERVRGSSAFPLVVAPGSRAVLPPWVRRILLVVVFIGSAWVATVVSAGSAAAHTLPESPTAQQGAVVPLPPPTAESHDVDRPDQPMPLAPAPRPI